MAEAISQADIVVVGTVLKTRSLNRIATVQVEDVWKGDVGAKFELVAGPSSDRSFTSVDRTYELGQRYLLFGFEPAAHGARATFGARIEDNRCSLTQPYHDELAADRPATAHLIASRTSKSSTVAVVLVAAASRRR